MINLRYIVSIQIGLIMLDLRSSSPFKYYHEPASSSHGNVITNYTTKSSDLDVNKSL